jgi:hypothetical protein
MESTNNDPGLATSEAATAEPADTAEPDLLEETTIHPVAEYIPLRLTNSWLNSF